MSTINTRPVRVFTDNDGPKSGLQVHIVDAETGEPIKYVTGVDICIRVGEVVRATIYTIAGGFDMICVPEYPRRETNK